MSEPVLSVSEVQKTVETILSFKKEHKKDTSGKAQSLFEKTEYIRVQCSLYAVPVTVSQAPLRLDIPHTLCETDTEACLFVSKNHSRYEKLIAEGSLPSQVVKVYDIAQIHAQFNRFESRRKLLNSYDMFLCDRRCAPRVASLLGKKFFDKKKTPIPVKATGDGVKRSIEIAINSTYLRRDAGNTISVRCGTTEMSAKDIAENAIEITNQLSSILGVGATRDGNWRNFRCVSLSTSGCPALPIFRTELPKSMVDVEGNAKTDAEKAEVAQERQKIMEEADEEEKETFAELEKILGPSFDDALDSFARASIHMKKKKEKQSETKVTATVAAEEEEKKESKPKSKKPVPVILSKPKEPEPEPEPKEEGEKETKPETETTTPKKTPKKTPKAKRPSPHHTPPTPRAAALKAIARMTPKSSVKRKQTETAGKNTPKVKPQKLNLDD